MKIVKAFAFIVTIGICFTACKKNNNNSVVDPPVKKLKYLTQTTILQNGITSKINYTYDDRKRLATIKNGDGITTYYYSTNMLSFIETVNPTLKYRQETNFTYKDGALSSVHQKTLRDNNLVGDITYNYLVVNGKTTEIHHEIYVETYTYDGRGNVTKVHFNENNLTNEYTYDDKPNLYTNGFPKYVLQSNVNYFSNNNQLTRSGLPAFTYTYGADGYPVSAVAGAAQYSFIYTEL
jgi:YD repeat-containing protein